MFVAGGWKLDIIDYWVNGADCSMIKGPGA